MAGIGPYRIAGLRVKFDRLGNLDFRKWPFGDIARRLRWRLSDLEQTSPAW